MAEIGPTLVRVALALVFLWFGSQQLIDSGMWLRFIPEAVVSALGLSAHTLVHFNGAFEIVFGLALLIGLFPRTSALLLGLHLLSIAFTLGLTPVGVRDFGLALATLSITFSGPGPWTVMALCRSCQD